MTTLTWLGLNSDKRQATAWGMLINVIQLVLLGLALYVAIKDIGLIEHTATKIWVIVLAALVPELFLCLHGLSTSASGISFFGGAPIEARASSFTRRVSSKAARAASDSLGLDTSDLTEDSSSSLF